MTPRKFLLLNTIVVILLLWTFLKGLKPSNAPSRLIFLEKKSSSSILPTSSLVSNSSSQNQSPPPLGIPSSARVHPPANSSRQLQTHSPSSLPGGVSAASSRLQPTPSVKEVSSAQNHPLPARELNAVFMYNGYLWDAYELLGIPAGSSFEVAKQAYSQQREKMSSGQDLIEAAFEAICKSVNSTPSS